MPTLLDAAGITTKSQDPGACKPESEGVLGQLCNPPAGGRALGGFSDDKLLRGRFFTCQDFSK
jgi:hypothetical protein